MQSVVPPFLIPSFLIFGRPPLFAVRRSMQIMPKGTVLNVVKITTVQITVNHWLFVTPFGGKLWSVQVFLFTQSKIGLVWLCSYSTHSWTPYPPSIWMVMSRRRTPKMFKVRSPGVYFVVGHVPDPEVDLDHDFMVCLFMEGIRCHYPCKKSHAGRLLKICAGILPSLPNLVTLRPKSMDADVGGWVLLGPMTQDVFKTASKTGELTGIRDEFLGECRPRSGTLLIMKVVLHLNLSVSVLWHQKCHDHWIYEDHELDFELDENGVIAARPRAYDFLVLLHLHCWLRK